MILAATDGDWIVPLLVVIFGLINWVWGKVKPSAPAPPPTRRAPTAPRRPAGTQEEERMRKFLEALGVPPDSTPEATRIPTRQAPPPRRESTRPAYAPPPLPATPPATSTTVPRLPIEPRIVPELVTPVMREFTTVSSTIGAVPTDRRPPLVSSAEALTPGERLRQDLASPTQIRSAFLLREILGPPLGLQS